MRSHPTLQIVLLMSGSVSLAGLVGLGGTGCAPEPSTSGMSDSGEILATEEVAGPIDAELSTEADPRGRRGVESGRVLPPGFPAELPIPAGASVVEQGRSKDGKRFVVLGTSASAVGLPASWASLLEVEGWSVHRSGDSTLRAAKRALAITATVTPAGAGSRLRIVY